MNRQRAEEIVATTNLLSQPLSNFQLELLFRAEGYLAGRRDALEEVGKLVEAVLSKVSSRLAQ